MTISSGFITEIETADEGVTQFTTLRIESGIVNWPRSLTMETVFMFSEYQKIGIMSTGQFGVLTRGDCSFYA